MKIDISTARQALEAGEFFPYFQPLVTLGTGQLAGFEVLARWNHPEVGMIAPDRFIPPAERDGWIGALTEQILFKAFISAISIPRPLRLSVNISPIQLRDPSLPKQIEGISRRTGFSLDRVVVEITESALADNLEQARLIARELKSLGCRIALDDFGTGYSSLRHLQSLPFDELKVDGSFVRSMTNQRESRKIVAAVVGLGQSLGLTTVAEGVETQEQAEMLRWLGCEIGQGYFWGMPVPEAELQSAISVPRRRISTQIAYPWKNLTVGNLEGLPAQKLAQLQAIYENSPVGLAFLDRNFRYVNLNPQLAEIHGIPVEEHLGKTAQEAVPWLFAKFEPHLRRAMRGEAVVGFEVNESAGSPGGGKTFLASYQPARDEAGDVVGVSVAVVDFTARKKAQKKLEQYERVVEGLEEMVVVVDRDCRYVLANRSFLAYRATTSEKLIGRTVPDSLNPEDFQMVYREKLHECFNGNVVKYESKFTHPTLGQRDLVISYFPIEVFGGISGAACLLRDNTELKKMAQANLEWQERIELAQQSGVRIGLWDWDVVANTVVWSDETYRQWGFTRDNFSCRLEDALPRIHEADLPGVEQAIRDVQVARGVEFTAQYRVVRPDGTICWIDAHAEMARDGSHHMLGIGVDITGLKMVEESLRESEEKYLLLLNSTAEAIYGLDMNGNCTFCNPACLRLLRFDKPEDLLTKNMHWTVHHSRLDGSPYPVEDCAIFAAIRNGTASHVTKEVLWRSDGTCFPVEYWSYPMHKAGELVGAVVTFLDISNR
jgi:PAS domain S-box-containing protein